MKKLLVLIVLLVLTAACAPFTGPTPLPPQPMPLAPEPTPTVEIVGVNAPWRFTSIPTELGQVGLAVTVKEGDSFQVVVQYGDENFLYQDTLPELAGVPALDRIIAECPPLVVLGPPYVEMTWRRVEFEKLVVCVGEENPHPYAIKDNMTGESSTIVPLDVEGGSRA